MMKMQPTQTARRCSFVSEANRPCKANAQLASEFCFFHDPAVQEKRTASRRAGGIARTRPIVLSTTFPTTPLRTASDVVELLSETINQVRRGELDLRVSNAIGYLSGILLSAIERSCYEERLSVLEAAIDSSNLSTSDPPLENDLRFEFIEKIPFEKTILEDESEPPDPN
jgi:hypothetical protein